ncbi:vault protein inter-alpha-trypsin [Colletotrichum orchidophilum]|uniref:Vault protein inter-alpha-trypsin n=1 Tax=Colletotrichum orchidophilum TaxID=1209926 RepID=A0A1G4B8X4_9PEZI|nr:vault protein inter-alpha-trypsin [Colletotrichum orchidophilum]OHE97722.1 vault protein inter-alpha-trypsin [Colletotrichum orchidophilum]
MVFGVPRSQASGGLFSRPAVQPTNPHICGLYYIDLQRHDQLARRYLPTLSQSVHARIIALTSRTTLTQTFVNPSSTALIPELRYTFPLYDGVSVVAFTCTINNDRVIRGVVQEKNAARKTYNQAVADGQTAGLLEQLPDASDVFTTTIGNVPAGAEIAVEIEYLGELKHDAEVDGIRFTIPTSIAPRYGSFPGELLAKPTNVSAKDGIQIVVDAEVPAGSVIRSIQSPSHPISVSVGSTSTMDPNATPSLQLASATLSLGTAQLEHDFIVQVIATNTSNPVAVLETHPTIPHQQALMATLVPKFKIAATKPEVVFICDRSGSMQGNKMDDLKNALRVFMKSLPVGSMFNICSFGSSFSFLFRKSVTYDQNTLETAMRHIDTFDANYGGTEIYNPIEETFNRRHTDLDLETFVLTDGEVWNEVNIFGMVERMTRSSKGAIRLFTLGVGRDVSHSLIEGLARAGNGFSQSVSENEKMSGKVVRMLKGALTPHVNDYALEVKYADAESETEAEDDFDVIEPEDAAREDTTDNKRAEKTKHPISLFDTSSDDDVAMEDAQPQDDTTGVERYSHIPTVKPPKILQAPFQIPPLFPYNRTSVYLLLSPDRELRFKTPESLILRGTSSQGPLELRIPITILADKAETIHQLAARKAVKELEEGRGWIYHAKDRDGNRLQPQHPGRFPGMVEREAVRLGIQFQVGGKWCSFVAVEHRKTGEDKGPDAVDADQAKSRMHELDSTQRREARTRVGWGGMPRTAQSQARSPAFSYGSAGMISQPAAGLFGTAPTSAVSAHQRSDGLRSERSVFGRPNPAASSNPFAPSSGGSVFGVQPFSYNQQQQSTATGAFVGSLFGQPTAPGTSGGGLFGQSTAPAISGGGLFGQPTAPVPAPTPAAGGLFGSNPSRTVSPFGAGPASAKSSGGPHVFGGNGSGGGLFGQPRVTSPVSSMPQSGGLFGSARPTPQLSGSGEPLGVQAAALAPPTTEVNEALLELFNREMSEASCMSLPDDISDDDWESEAPPTGAAVAAPIISSLLSSAADKFPAIVSLQEFSGSWDPSEALFTIIGVTLDSVKDALHTVGVDDERVMSTSAVINYLRKKLTKERDSWEMMEEKAVAWLEGELGEEATQKVLAITEGLF